MPLMPRCHSKATKIAYSILGVPENLRKRRLTKEEKRINRRLLFEETARVR